MVGDPVLLRELEEVSVYELTSSVSEGEYVVGAGVIVLPKGVSAVNAPDSLVVIVRKVLG